MNTLLKSLPWTALTIFVLFPLVSPWHEEHEIILILEPTSVFLGNPWTALVAGLAIMATFTIAGIILPRRNPWPKLGDCVEVTENGATKHGIVQSTYPRDGIMVFFPNHRHYRTIYPKSKRKGVRVKIISDEEASFHPELYRPPQ